jgi:Asp-tRNA(Asn)/Glu-tRNA(Gln) amidotransferase A subunit family amidase
VSRLRRASDFAAAYAGGRTTPREVAERFLVAWAASEGRDPPLRVFISVDEARLRAEADAATARWRSGSPRSPLDGVLVAVKDAFDVAGTRTTGGTKVLGATPVTADAPAVARLREAGALVAGKANLHELCAGPSGVNVHHGVARNPWDPMRDPGGSSSGSGAAVAAGFTPLALGSDTLGSIRIPASLCGVAGLKGTFGRVPTDGVVPLARSLDHAGPLGASVGDLRLAWSLLTGSTVTDEKLPRPRLGVCEAWWRDADPEVARVARAAVERVGEAVPIELPHVGLSPTAGSVILLVEAAEVNRRLLGGDAPLQTSVRVQLEMGRGLREAELRKAQQLRTLLARDFARALEQVDFVVSPTTAIVAPRFHEDAFSDGEADQSTIDKLILFTSAANLTGLPAASVPCGLASGLPVGLQLMGPARGEARLLAAAELVEHCVEFSVPVAVDLLA